MATSKQEGPGKLEKFFYSARDVGWVIVGGAAVLGLGAVAVSAGAGGIAFNELGKAVRGRRLEGNKAAKDNKDEK